MPELQRGATSTSVIDVLDHILDKGVVIDAWVRVSVAGIDLLTVEARIVVASIDTYLNSAEAVAHIAPGLATFAPSPAWRNPPPRASEHRSVAATLRTHKR